MLKPKNNRMTNKTTSAIDLVERAKRYRRDNLRETTVGFALIGELADTITRLQAALEPFAADWDAAQAYKDFLGADRREIYLANCVDLAAFERAREALSSVGGE